MTRTFFDLPRPCGRTTVPRTIWSACFGSTPKRSVTSTVSSNLLYLTFCSSGTASCRVYGRASTAFRALAMFLPSFFMLFLCLPPLAVLLTNRSDFDSDLCGSWQLMKRCRQDVASHVSTQLLQFPS